MKTFTTTLLKWTCFAINTLFWGYSGLVGFIAIMYREESSINFDYSQGWAMVGSIVILSLGIAIYSKTIYAFAEFLFFFVVISTFLSVLVPMKLFIVPAPNFDRYSIIDPNKDEVLESGIVRIGCYKERNFKKAVTKELNKICDNCLGNSKPELLIHKRKFYSYRFAELFGLSESLADRCFIGSLSEWSLIQKLLFPLRIACEQSYFGFFVVFAFFSIPATLLDLRNARIGKRLSTLPTRQQQLFKSIYQGKWSNIPPLSILGIDQNKLYWVTGVIVFLIFIFNYLYFKELNY